MGKFGWDLPPGVSLSDPGGPHDPTRMAAEVAEEKLWDAIYQVQRAGFTRQEIEQVWAAAAEDAHDDEESDAFAERLEEERMAQYESDMDARLEEMEENG